MLSLKPANFLEIQHWFVDYQKKSRNYEMPPEEGQILGIYNDDKLIGYFILICSTNGIVEINQGYLAPEARHKANNITAMKLLEGVVKKAGYKEIVLATNRAVGSYQKFMRNIGFEMTRVIFSKKVI